jgi:hypothetical protein
MEIARLKIHDSIITSLTGSVTRSSPVMCGYSIPSRPISAGFIPLWPLEAEQTGSYNPRTITKNIAPPTVIHALARAGIQGDDFEEHQYFM